MNAFQQAPTGSDPELHGLTPELVANLREWWDAKSKPAISTAEEALYAQAWCDGFVEGSEAALGSAASWIGAIQHVIEELGLELQLSRVDVEGKSTEEIAADMTAAIEQQMTRAGIAA